MKAKIIAKTGSLFTWIIAVSVLALGSIDANAHTHAYVPEALCTTAIPNVNMPVQPFVCCQLLNREGHHIWRDTWVFGSCKNANPGAIYDMGCKTYSPVYRTGMPIQASCQFSHSTGRYL